MSSTMATAIANLICFSLTFMVMVGFWLVFWATEKLSGMNSELRSMAIGKDWGEVPKRPFHSKVWCPCFCC